MLLRTRGIPLNFEADLVGRVTRNPDKLDELSFLLVDQEPVRTVPGPYLGMLTKQASVDDSYTQSVIYRVPTLDHLAEGDIVSVSQDGNINTLYRVNSPHNTLLATERCNSNCLMCSQPPKDKDDINRLFDVHQKLIPLIPKDCDELGISGGEPTLMGNHFFTLLEQLQEHLPQTEIHILTNGRTFAWNHVAERLARMNYSRVMLGIPVYSDYYQEHDHIVQAPNAFNQTILGLHNLARYNQRIEIRVVLHKLSIPRLVKLAKYIYKNLPFAEHVTFMGLEYVGYTPHNIDKLWIDPYDYMDELGEAVEFLAVRGMNVSIYNTQLCIMPEPLWKYARKSISDWKNSFLPECTRCARLEECGGLFTWNLKKPSQHIQPF
ncbi:His-Xaa-Ser system radical SAM maturase HxsC [Spirosoma pollinicola]|uniref:His-Xaa-Ser system radical SAM maturase HxsC n=1 Tax=Spirosoma pollinicola TaxID=2057025 RepID=A0A2K8Z6A4_9BACT|nr:His-Xaa-Ser system radical SAM maturase HxsC [Spirosoma pollinicola]AUD05401.1 His-Xaa-Ser system radical SAM maturase HxsC [Spirosoma pollinicola]